MIVYLSSPMNQMQAQHAAGMPVLFSFGELGPVPKNGKRPWYDSWHQTFKRILIDSGAFKAFKTGKPIEGPAYLEWHLRWIGHADAIAGLDDINGDWRQSLRNYEAFGGFPTIHDTDPPELLKDLISIARERGNWIGIGLKPPREGKEKFVRWVCDNVPEDLHIHGWALRLYTHVRRLGSVDSTNWFKDSWKLMNVPELKHLTPGECLEIIVKRYARETRVIKDHKLSVVNLFADVE